jgi:hypothetical protein
MDKTTLTTLQTLAGIGADIAAMLAQPATRPLGEGLARMLGAHYLDVFPAEKARLLTARDQRRAERLTRMATEGPALWAELHRRALQPVADERAEQQWLRAFAGRLPCGDCRAFYATYLRDTPPRFGDYFAWSAELHNAVNVKLGKPAMIEALARVQWSA